MGQEAPHEHEEHPHSHRGHAHAHAPRDFGRAFAVGTVLNLGFVMVEAIYGLIANSTALLADAGHNFGDVLGLVLAWGAASMAKRAPTVRFTYGLRASSILAALGNAALLLVAVGAIAWEAIWRLMHPEPVAETTVIVVAAIGILINGATALLFMSGQRDDINVRGAFLHMAADAGVSLGVVVAGLLMTITGWLWLDPAVSLVIASVIVWSTWGLLRESVVLSLHAVPAGVDPDAVRAYLGSLPDVTDVHDLHIWPMSTTETALTCHLIMPHGHPGDAFLQATSAELGRRFHIAHATLQIELGDAAVCGLAPDEVV